MARDPFSRRLRRHWRLLLAILIPVALLTAGEIAGWPFLRQPAEHLLSQRLERPARISAPFRLRFLGSLRLQAAGLWLAAPAGFAVPYFLDAQNIDLRLRYRDLWHFRRTGELRIATLDVDRMDVRLLRNADGDVSWRFGKPSPEKPPALPAVEFLSIRQGSLIFQDPLLETDIEARFSTKEGSANMAPGSFLRAKGEFRERPLAARLETSSWLPAADRRRDTPPMAAKGWLEYGKVRIDFGGTVQDPLGRQGIRGAVGIRGSSLALLGQLFNTPLPTTGPFTLKGSVDKTSDVWRVQVDSAEVGKSRLKGRFTYDPRLAPPRLDGELGGQHFVLADLGPSFGTRDEEGEPVAPQPGTILPDRPLNLPELKNLNARLAVRLDRVDLGSAFKEPIQPFSAILTVDNGKMGLAEVDAQTAKGRLTGSISVDALPEPPQWAANLAWQGIRLDDWLRSARAGTEERKAPGKAPGSPYFTGLLQGRAKLTGKGQSTAELLGSLDGEITTFVRDATMSHLVIEILGLDIAQGLGLVIKGDETLPVRCAVADLLAQNGTITPQVVLVDTPVTLILADGQVNLAKESLNLRLTARPRNVSPFTVRSPILVRGSFADPQATPEPVPIAARVASGIALAVVAPLAAILPFIDPGDSKESPCAQALTFLKR